MARTGWGRHTVVATGSNDATKQVSVNAWNNDLDTDGIIGFTPETIASASTVTMHFNSRNGAATDDGIVVTHTGHTTKAFMTEIVKFMQANQKNPFLVVADKTNPTAVTNMIASVAVATVA